MAIAFCFVPGTCWQRATPQLPHHPHHRQGTTHLNLLLQVALRVVINLDEVHLLLGRVLSLRAIMYTCVCTKYRCGMLWQRTHMHACNHMEAIRMHALHDTKECVDTPPSNALQVHVWLAEEPENQRV